MIKLNEALDLSTVDKAAEGIKSGSIGEKVPQELKLYIGPAGGITDIEEYFKQADLVHADKSKTIQWAVKVAAHSDDPVLHFHLWSTREFVPNLAKYCQADWLKNNEIFKGLSTKGVQYTRHDLEVLRGFIREESLKHGKNTKGSGGKNQDVSLLYKDENWILLTPHSWDAEKKIAFFTNDKGEKEKCHWCTASGADISWYNNYTYSNTKPLYVMINKDDQAWQLAYYPSGGRVEFLNEWDRSDDFTKGGWMEELPLEMQEKIVNEFNGLSMADYTKAVNGAIDNPENEPFKVKFLPWVEIAGETKVESNFNAFMLQKNQIVESRLELSIRIKSHPAIKTVFTLTKTGPSFPYGFDTALSAIEKRFIKIALLQYTAEVMNLDVDYTEEFDKALATLKQSA